ncbi:MAG: preprotein translocase subunit YajC [Helicobacteraceae bacterium]|nr:preprotein translocase subunit YajC [Helicobacteraceae bacterium]
MPDSSEVVSGAANAADAAAGAPGLLGMLPPLLVMLAFFYFFIIRPNQQQAKRHKEMIATLQRGDRVVTTGGIYAEVVKADENEEFIKVEISKDVVVKIDKSSVARKIEIDAVKS